MNVGYLWKKIVFQNVVEGVKDEGSSQESIINADISSIRDKYSDRQISVVLGYFSHWILEFHFGLGREKHLV